MQVDTIFFEQSPCMGSAVVMQHAALSAYATHAHTKKNAMPDLDGKE